MNYPCFKINFIFPTGRVGIWGWSYGGYATLKTLSMDTGKCSTINLLSEQSP